MDDTEIRKTIREELELYDLKKQRDILVREKWKHLLDAENTKARFGSGSEGLFMALFKNTMKDIEIINNKIYEMDKMKHV